jgi:hypothetical protein
MCMFLQYTTLYQLKWPIFVPRKIFKTSLYPKEETILLFLEYKDKCAHKVCQMNPLTT